MRRTTQKSSAVPLKLRKSATQNAKKQCAVTLRLRAPLTNRSKSMLGSHKNSVKQYRLSPNAALCDYRSVLSPSQPLLYFRGRGLRPVYTVFISTLCSRSYRNRRRKTQRRQPSHRMQGKRENRDQVSRRSILLRHNQDIQAHNTRNHPRQDSPRHR